MSQTITMSPKTVEMIINRLDQLTREVKVIKAKLFEQEPSYGSPAWWEWSEKKADEDINTGKVIEFDSVEKATKWLNS